MSILRFAFQPVLQGRASADIPRADFFGWQRFDRFQFFTKFYFALSLNVISENDLVAQLKGVMPDKTDDLTIQTEFLLDLTQHAALGRFTLFQKACHNAEPLLWPTFVARQDDFALMLNDRRHNRDRAIPVDEIA